MHASSSRKNADYLLQVKENRPKLAEAIKAIPEGDFSQEHETCDRGHGRTEHRYYKVADAPEELPFPHAAQVVIAYRERGDLADVMTSAETSYYVTSVTKAKAGPERLGAHVRGHWGIESLHWIRDWCFDEDRHQLRSANLPRVMATLRNLAIAL
ncbi:MAG: ISAs1 family transposase, partial [Acidimicrobiales bacterium]